MSADDQRAAEERVLELCDMDYERAAATAAEFDRLRAELAETRAELHGATGAAAVLRERGDVLAAALVGVLDTSGGWQQIGEAVKAARAAEQDWRSVRGDAPAPAEPPADAYTEGYRRGAKAQADICEAEHVDLGPAVELPATLSSVDDVVAVFRSVPGMSERAGPGSHRVYQDPRGVYLSVLEAPGPVVMIVAVHGCDGERYTHSGPRLSRDALLAAIEAARGGSR